MGGKVWTERNLIAEMAIGWHTGNRQYKRLKIYIFIASVRIKEVLYLIYLKIGKTEPTHEKE